MVDEDISRRSIAVTVKTAKLSARALAYVLVSVGRKLSKREPPHGKMSVKKLMSHGTGASSIELSGDTALFDRVARKWNVDYAFYKTEPGKYLLFFKSNQADAMTACFAEYSQKVLRREKAEKLPIREQIEKAREAISKKERQNGAPTKSNDFVGRGGTTERADFGGNAAKVAERSLCRRQEREHER